MREEYDIEYIRYLLRTTKSDRDYYARKVQCLDEEIADLENELDLRLEENANGV